jgi:hypothetical protein
MLLCGLSGLSLLLGTAVAYAADRHPSRKPTLEMWGGLLIIGGFALLGFALAPYMGRL